MNLFDRSWSVLAVLGTCLSLSFATGAQAQERYQILVTNDDGVESDGIRTLARELRSVGVVTVVAPCGERSGSSMSVSLREPVRIQPTDLGGGLNGFCVDSSPAGAALLAINQLAPEGGFDVVVSGINRGANVGTVSHMSGTVGGAMMGAYHGIPAVAASLGAGSDFGYSARFVASFVEELREQGTPAGVVFSINIPRPQEEQIEGVTIAKMAGSQLQLGFEEVEPEDGFRMFRPDIGLATTAPSESDTGAYLQNRITITPLLFDWTAYPMLEVLEDWGLSHVLGG